MRSSLPRPLISAVAALLIASGLVLALTSPSAHGATNRDIAYTVPPTLTTPVGKAPSVVDALLDATARHNNVIDGERAPYATTDVTQSPYESAHGVAGHEPSEVQIGSWAYEANTDHVCWAKYPVSARFIGGKFTVKGLVRDAIENDVPGTATALSDFTFKKDGGTVTYTAKKNHKVHGRILLNRDGSVHEVSGGEGRDLFSYPAAISYPAVSPRCDADDALPVPAYVTAALKATAAHANIVGTTKYVKPHEQLNPDRTVLYSAQGDRYAYYNDGELMLLSSGGHTYALTFPGNVNGGCYVRRNSPGTITAWDATINIFEGGTGELTSGAPGDLDYIQHGATIDWTVGWTPAVSGTLTLGAGGALAGMTSSSRQTTKFTYPASLRFPAVPRKICKK